MQGDEETWIREKWKVLGRENVPALVGAQPVPSKMLPVGNVVKRGVLPAAIAVPHMISLAGSEVGQGCILGQMIPFIREGCPSLRERACLAGPRAMHPEVCSCTEHPPELTKKQPA